MDVDGDEVASAGVSILRAICKYLSGCGSIQWRVVL